ncbi:MAG: Lrp/AsnC family transcriptional regulator [Gemmatimonadaceae bacterium]|nr:Lrp/AsnC family transcriptional regulator [Acetobacteraceae bacterium]
MAIVQRDAGVTIGELAHRVGMSPSSAQRRLQKLRDDKIILRDVSVVDPNRMGPSLAMLVEIELERDRPALLAPFQQWIARTPEVQQAWCITGRGDYTLVIMTGSIADFDRLTERMMEANPNIRKFTTSVVLKTLKRTLEIPIE